MARIAYFSSVGTLDVGGPLSTLKTILLFAEEHDVRVVLPETGPFADALETHGIPVTILPFPRLRRFHSPLAIPGYVCRVARAGVRFRRWLRQERIELVHFSDLIDAPFYLPARLAGCRILAHLRVILERPLWCTLYRLLVRSSVDAVVCVSLATEGSMFPRDSSRSRVVYDPGPAPAFLGAPRPEPDAREGLRLLAIAKFFEAKGHANLIEVVRRLVESGVEVRSTIVGRRQEGHEAYHDRCMALLDRYGLRARFELIDFLPPEELARALDHCHVFVHLPNYQDPFPGVVLEAMARARPVVAFDSGGVREEFADGESGLLVPQGDLDGAAAAIRRLAESPALRRDIGMHAREFATAHFSAARHRREMAEVYERLLPRSPTS